MKNWKRFLALGATLVAAAGLSVATALADDQVVITVAHSIFENSPEHLALLEFKDTIEAESNGSMTVQIYPNATLGGDATQLAAVQDGNVTLSFAASAAVSNLVPECEIFDIPFMFPDLETARTTLADEDLKATLGESFEKVGLKMVGASIPGFRWLTTNKETNSMEDLKGQKIRTMENPNHIALWNSLGANATPINGGELFTALQQGTVDGQENPISVIYNGKIYEVNKYVVDTRHIMNISPWVVNLEWYNALSDENREIFDNAIATAIERTNVLSDETEASYKEELTGDLGMTMIELDDSIREEMKAATGDVEGNVRKDIGDELVDSVLDIINQ